MNTKNTQNFNSVHNKYFINFYHIETKNLKSHPSLTEDELIDEERCYFAIANEQD